jgi:hypothetical protein
MKRPSKQGDPVDRAEPGSQLKRRGVLLGTGVAALAGVAGAVAARSGPTEVPEVRADARPRSEAEGYRLTAHVKRYYETIRV